jgi:hypothetical protein
MLFTLILVKTLIRFPILCCYINLTILASLQDMSPGSKVTSRNSSIHILGTFSSSFLVLLGVPQGSTLGPLLFNIFVNDICIKIYYSNFPLFADDLKPYYVIKSAEDCKCLQADIHSVKRVVF